MNDDDDFEPYEPDEFEEALANCCGSFGKDGRFWCGAAGSEDCDFECPFSRDIGMTAEEADASDEKAERSGDPRE